MNDIVKIGDATLYHGDCMDILPTLGKVDAVVTDPPYLNMGKPIDLTHFDGVAKKRNKTVTVSDPWVANLEWIPFAIELTEKAFFSFCSFHFVAEIRNKIPFKPTALISWYKPNTPPSAANAPQFNTEYCWAFRIGKGLDWRKLKTHYQINNLTTGCMATERILNKDGTTAHPTQKPVLLIEQFLIIGCESVLDPFMGSGTTGVACANLGRKFIGIERERKYFDIACERIEAAYAQGRLAL